MLADLMINRELMTLKSAPSSKPAVEGRSRQEPLLQSCSFHKNKNSYRLIKVEPSPTQPFLSFETKISIPIKEYSNKFLRDSKVTAETESLHAQNPTRRLSAIMKRHKNSHNRKLAKNDFRFSTCKTEQSDLDCTGVYSLSLKSDDSLNPLAFPTKPNANQPMSLENEETWPHRILFRKQAQTPTIKAKPFCINQNLDISHKTFRSKQFVSKAYLREVECKKMETHKKLVTRRLKETQGNLSTKQIVLQQKTKQIVLQQKNKRKVETGKGVINRRFHQTAWSQDREDNFELNGWDIAY